MSSGEESVRVTSDEWNAHLRMIGALEQRVDAHDLEMHKMVAETVEGIMIRMSPLVETACEAALRRVSGEEAWWRENVRQMVKHATDMGSAWFGKKFLLFAAGLVASALLVWLVRTGRIE